MSWTVLIANEEAEADEDVLVVWDEVDDDWLPTDDMHNELDPLDPHTGAQTIGDEWGSGLFLLLDNEHGSYDLVQVDEDSSTDTTYSFHL